jgi:hypothetical protein
MAFSGELGDGSHRHQACAKRVDLSAAEKAMTSRSAQTARKMLRQIAVVLAYSCPNAFRPGDHIAAGVGAEERHKILGRQVKPSTVSTHKYANSAVRSKQFSSL